MASVYSLDFEGGIIMGIYTNMTRLACYIAQADMQDWNKQDIEEMVEFCGVKPA